MTNFSLALQNPDLLTTSDVDTPAERFEYFRRALKKYGEALGTGHKRIAIPKSLLSEEELTDTLGFVPVDVAIPEAGQTDWASYRNPYSTYHLHEHGAFWTMHQDEYTASTMMSYRYVQEQKKKGKEPSLVKRAELFFRGLPHVITEGIPGAYYYIRGQITGAEDMLERLRAETSSKYWDFLNTMQQKVEGEQGVLSSLLGGSLKRRLATTVWSSLFSAKDDAYNTIEGMRHGGMAGDMRPYNTDFGSGLTTEMFGSVKAFIQASKQSVRSAIKKKIDPMLVVKEAEEIARLGPSAKVVIENIGGTAKLKGTIDWSEEGMRQFLAKRKVSEEYINIFKVHEASENIYGLKAIEKARPQAKREVLEELGAVSENLATYKAVAKAATDPPFGSHKSPGVIVDEVLMAMKEGEQAFQALKRYRFAELARVEKEYGPGLLGRLFGKKLTVEQQQVQKYVSRTRKIYATMEKNYLPRFSADHGAYNTIEGMSHKGMAGQMRPVNTDMGSRSDPLRAIARGMGISFENLLKKPEWKEALASAKFVKGLGRGSFGEAALYKTTIGGKDIRLVKKTIHEQAEENLEYLAQRYSKSSGKSLAETRETYRKSLNLEQEASFYRELGETPSVPSAYDASQKELWMEYMPGSELMEITQRQRSFTLPPKAKAELYETVDIMKQRGIFNPDIHERNIKYSEETGRVSLLDFGQAERNKTIAATEAQAQIERVRGVVHPVVSPEVAEPIRQSKAIGSKAVSIPANPRAKRKAAAAAKKLQRARDLDKAKQAIWEAQHLGGNRHVIKPIGQPVEQISVFADTIKP